MFICNRALRRIFGSEQEEVTEGWRKPYSEELYSRHCIKEDACVRCGGNE
jgi:hypothetical protein